MLFSDCQGRLSFAFMGGMKCACQVDPRCGSSLCRHGWEGATMGIHEWVQGLMAAFQEAQEQERQARQDHTFQATGDSQQTLMGTHVIKALQVSPPLPFAPCSFISCSCLSHDGPLASPAAFCMLPFVKSRCLVHVGLMQRCWELCMEQK